MKRKILLPVFLILSFFIIFINNSNSRISGSSMQMECAGEDSIKVIVNGYRDCKEAPFDDTLLLNIEPEGTSNNFSVTAQLKKVEDITKVCDVDNSCMGGVSVAGNERGVYEATIDISNFAPSECMIDINFYAYPAEATQNLTNIEQYYTYWSEATYNRCTDSCISTPEYDIKPLTVMCERDTFVTRQAPEGAPEDSMVYELVDPLIDNGVPVTWKDHYNASEPLDYLFPFFGPEVDFPLGFNLTDDGYLKFVSELTNGEFMGRLAIQSEQYRNDTLISRTRHDMTVRVIECPDEGPEFLFDDEVYLCADELNQKELPIQIFAYESTGYFDQDSIFVDFRKPIEGATFIPDEDWGKATGLLEWTPDISKVREEPYRFYVHAEYKNCPLPREGVAQVDAYVTASPKGEYTITQSSCGEINFALEEKKPNYVKWTGQDNLDSGDSAFTHQYPAGGEYTFELHLANKGCDTLVIHDTVEVDPLLSLDAGNDTMICQGQTMLPEPNIQYYEGMADSVLFTVNGHEFYQNQEITPAGDTTLVVEAEDAAGCEAVDSFSIDHRPLPEPDVNDQYVCAGQEIAPVTTAHHTDYDIQWYRADGTLLSAGEEFPVPEAGDYVLRIEDRALEGCDVHDTFTVAVADAPELSLSDTALCEGDQLKKGAGVHADSYEWRFLPEDQFLGTDSLLSYEVSGSGGVQLTIEETFGTETCTYRDTFHIEASETPEADLSHPGDQCINNESVNLPQHDDHETTWSGTGISDHEWDLREAGTGIHLLHYTITHETSGCQAADSAEAEILPAPELSFTIDSTSGETPFTVNLQGETDNEATTENITWQITDASDSIVATYHDELAVSHTFDTSGVYSIRLTAEHTESGCTDEVFREDAITVSPGDPNVIIQEKDHEIHIYPNPAGDKLHIVSERPLSNLRLISAEGREIKNKTQPDKQTTINVNHYPPGTYILELKTQDGELVRERVVLE